MHKPAVHGGGERRDSGICTGVSVRKPAIALRRGFLHDPIKGAVLAALLLMGCTSGDETARVVENHYPQPSSPGEKVLRKYCSDCHAPPQPNTHTAAEWPNIILRMQQHRISKALIPMSEEQRRLLVAYMQKNAHDLR